MVALFSYGKAYGAQYSLDLLCADIGGVVCLQLVIYFAKPIYHVFV